MTAEAEKAKVAIDRDRLRRAWNAAIDELKEQQPDRRRTIDVWLGANAKVAPIEHRDGVVSVECPTPLFCTQIRSLFADAMVRILDGSLDLPVKGLECKVTRHARLDHLDQLQRKGIADAEAATQRRRSPTWGQGFKLLRDFVVGSCNLMAYDAIQRILDQPDNPTNPLFIHGSSGLGKTHLEQGLALAFKERHPHSNIIYMTCEQFRNAYLDAVQSGSLNGFRVKLRHADLFLVDDIHFLSRGQAEKTKAELFETFNELAEHGKKVVFTSDAHPADIKYLEDRFVQRFHGGLVVMLDRPDLTVRRGVIAAKARSQGASLPPEVVDFVAEAILDNVRELEGAVNRLVAYAGSFGRPIDLALARQALSDIIDRDRKEPRLKIILRSVADHFDITVEDIIGKSRAGPRSVARHIAMYTLKACSNDTYAAVGHAFGGKSHSTVTYACEQVARYRATDQVLDGFVEDLLLRLKRN